MQRSGRVANALSVAGILSLFLSACSHSSDGNPSQNQELVKADQYQEASACEVPYTAGERAGSLSGSSGDLRKTYFGKSYDRSYLEAILTSSAQETVDFVIRSGVNLMTAGRQKASCAMFASLTPAWGIGLGEWTAAVSGLPSGYSLQGLYLENHFGPNRDSKATIVIAPDTSRWTLVHEFFHHLFAEQFQRNTLKEELKARNDEAANGFISLYKDWDNLTEASEDKMVDKLLVHSQSERMLTILYPLEEVAIERNLIEEYQSGRFKFVPSVDVKNGVGYIHSSLKASRKISEQLIDILQEVSDGLGERRSELARANQYELKKEISKWQDLQDQLSPQMDFVNNQVQKLRLKSSRIQKPHLRQDEDNSILKNVSEDEMDSEILDAPACPHIQGTLNSIERLKRAKSH